MSKVKNLLKVETWPLERINPYPRNARKIPQRAVEKVAASLREYGWRQPIVVDRDGVIIAGHTRRLGALHNGWTEAPVHVAENLTTAQIRAYRLADNRTNEETAWDLDTLGIELRDLKGLDLDLGSVGFDMRELDRLVPRAIEPQYCDVIVARWQKFTGKQAKLQDGRTFAQVAAERVPTVA